MPNWPRGSQGVALVAGTVCILAIAITFAAYMRSPQTKTTIKRRRSAASLCNGVRSIFNEVVGDPAPALAGPEKPEQSAQQQQESPQLPPPQGKAVENEADIKPSEQEEDNLSNAATAGTSERSLDLGEAEAVTDDAGRLDSGIGSPKGTPQLDKGRLSLNRFEALNQSTPAHNLIEESLSAVCYSPLSSSAVNSSSLHVEVSTMSLADTEPSGSSGFGHESGSTINSGDNSSRQIPSGDMGSLKSETDTHIMNNSVEVQSQLLSSSSLARSAQNSPVKQETKSSFKKSKDTCREIVTNSEEAPVRNSTPAKEAIMKPKDARSPVRYSNNYVANNSSNNKSSNNQKHNNNNISNYTSNNKSRSPEHQSKPKAHYEPGEQTLANKDERRKDNCELLPNGGKAPTPSTKRKVVNALQNPSVANTTQMRRSASNWTDDSEDRHDRTDAQRHSSGSDVAADDKSEGSADSGKGGSDCPTAVIVPPTVYEFELAADLCGRLIGRQGQIVKSIKTQTGATVTVRQHSFHDHIKTVYVVGQADDVTKALGEIRKRFPAKQFPQVMLEPPKTPRLQMMTLPPNPDMVEVRVCSIDAANRVFLQLAKNTDIIQEIDAQMALLYGPGSRINAPPLGLEPPCPGSVCVSIQNGVAFRALLVATEPITVKYVDAGGYGPAQLGELKQIRSDVLGYPFQAVEMVLANIEPQSGVIFTADAMAATHQFVMNVQHAGGRFFARVISYEANVTCGELIGQMRDQSVVTLAEHLVQEGHARWVKAWDQVLSNEPAPPGTEPPVPTFSPADFPQLNATNTGSW